MLACKGAACVRCGGEISVCYLPRGGFLNQKVVLRVESQCRFVEFASLLFILIQRCENGFG
jgi:hypothetical protein